MTLEAVEARIDEAADRLLAAALAHLDGVAFGLLREVAASGVAFDNPGVDYVEVQIDRVTWDAIRSLEALDVP